MKNNLKILYVAQELSPYTDPTAMADTCRNLGQNFQEHGAEIRMFMPLYGTISERRHQLHEVIRLSGMNIIIEDADFPLVLKVGTMPQAKFQVYFVHNEDYFSREHEFTDTIGMEYEDNENRAVFFARGVIETVKKLCWTPDIIHCHGWFTSLLPFTVNKGMREFPFFENAKLITSLYNNGFQNMWNESICQNLLYEDIQDKDVKVYKKPDYLQVSKIAIDNSDGVIISEGDVHPELIAYAEQQKGDAFLNLPYEHMSYDKILAFYTNLLK